MNHVNSDFIQRIFDEVVVFRPQLKASVVVDDEFGETADVRLLGDVLIRAFPWPIGVEMRRLFSGSCRNLDKLRLDQLLKTAERSVHFSALVLFLEARRLADLGLVAFSEGFLQQLGGRFHSLSLGDMVWLFLESAKLCQQAMNDSLLSDLVPRISSRISKDLSSLVVLRNELYHHQVNLTNESIQKHCIEVSEMLTGLLVALAPLSGYRLVSVNEIRVESNRINPPAFDHVFNLLNSVDSDFKSTSVKNDWFTDSDAVLLVKSLKEPGQFISLSPLVIDTHGEMIDQRDKFHLKKDVFLYSKYRPGHLMYVGTEVTEKCDLRVLKNYDRLESEFQLLLAGTSTQA